jgi:hypothetical protein
MEPILEVVVKPQISIIWTATANIGSRDDKAAEFGAGVAVIAVKNIGADFHFQILGHTPDRPGLQDSGRVVHVVYAGEKYLKQRMQLHLDLSADVVFPEYKQFSPG